MKKTIQLSIPEPCHENWDAMTPADKGRFCASCQKNVIDFTRSSDREILEALKSGGQACGRFRASQLNRDLIAPREKSPFWATAGAAAIALLALGVNEAAAQTPTEAEKHQNQDENRGKNEEKEEFEGHDREKNEVTRDDFRGSTKIKGVVLDQSGMPIPAVNVKVAGTDKMVQTDFDGMFAIAAKEGDTLEFTYVGMKSKRLKVSKSDMPAVEMAMEDEITGLIIVDHSGKPRLGVASQYMFNY
ncbi:carboxypeptidase-like regulatory domain-containing protein [Flavobacterium sp. MFBS3-15]|uniref:carboxypeptidase-like regulatory domain-containing protein n=1 Tax=Flavobacterium sp. MFBS3-15 TaxID=2989816 RepID=UPI002235AD6A|nr:carboxypeptidase-like regulatory domain-containing protein [Flavobacterium sp. MFBS3-15]MCW4467579.1 carboxypeptidase-like regulatory domain-containing protein [Flavobacterium sp. MFBS3-15]